jgi:AcrR family transcriptional regulator
MNSPDEASERPGRKPRTAARRGPTRPQSPDTPELAERRAQAPTAQALIRATRRLFAEGGPEWATDKRIHDTASRPGGGKGVPLGTIRYYFGTRERLLVYVSRHEHLTELDRVRRALRSVQTSDQLSVTLLGLAEDLDHYQVAFGLLTEGRQMPELRATQHALWEDWLSKLTEMVSELQAREIVRKEHDPYALALLWSSVVAGLAAHRLAHPGVELKPALDLAQRYAASLP